MLFLFLFLVAQQPLILNDTVLSLLLRVNSNSISLRLGNMYDTTLFCLVKSLHSPLSTLRACSVPFFGACFHFRSWSLDVIHARWIGLKK